MRLLFIRHGDPDYTIDSLTEKGNEEAQALSALIRELHPGTLFVSPLGRARKTASYSLEALGEKARECDWLREFPARLFVGDNEDLQKGFPHARQEDGTYGNIYVWDMMPRYVAEHPELMDPVLWRKSDVAALSDMLPIYDHVKEEFEALLKEHGYVNEGRGLFRVERETEETLTFFCHFGISSVLLSILWGSSPFFPLQFLCMLPSSVTEVVTEERKQGEAYFRTLRIGDQSHLYMAGQRPSFAARYREVYSDSGHRN